MPLQILLIEDNPDDADLLIESLSEIVDERLEVRWVPNLRAGLNALEQSKFDAVLLDLSLPDSTGTHGVLAIRELSGEIPVVVLTGFDDKKTGLECLKKGAQEYLVKGAPSPESIYRAIAYSIERTRAENATKQLKLLEQREHFIAMLAHDLRGPINASESIVSLMLEGMVGSISDPQSELLTVISSSNKKLLLMINNVLEAYKLESGAENLEIGKIDLATLVNDCIKDAQTLATEKRIRISAQTPNNQFVFADYVAMIRVVNNLLSNALKFTPPDGLIEISLNGNNSKSILRVKDSGIGMSPEQLTRIFQRFYQTETKNRATGLGLGLHLCKSLMEAQNGSINCLSQPAAGTTFEVELPLAPADAA